VIRIAVVEDEPQQVDLFCHLLEKYESDFHISLCVSSFLEGDEFLDRFSPGDFDILLLDIQMPRIDGMTVAKKVRQVDDHILIIFITNIVQYAVQGYSVRAMDFIVKPLVYPTLVEKMNRAIEQLNEKSTNYVCIKTLAGVKIFDLKDIACVEILARKLLIHTLTETYQCNETLQHIEEKLNDARFFRCHAAFLVNLQHIKQIESSQVIVANRKVPVSRYRHKGLLDALTKYLGKNTP